MLVKYCCVNDKTDRYFSQVILSHLVVNGRTEKCSRLKYKSTPSSDSIAFILKTNSLMTVYY